MKSKAHNRFKNAAISIYFRLTWNFIVWNANTDELNVGTETFKLGLFKAAGTVSSAKICGHEITRKKLVHNRFSVSVSGSINS